MFLVLFIPLARLDIVRDRFTNPLMLLLAFICHIVEATAMRQNKGGGEVEHDCLFSLKKKKKEEEEKKLG